MADFLTSVGWWYLGVVNMMLLFMMGADKALAKSNARRIPEKVLFTFAILGGAFGGTVGMSLFRHKTKHWYFKVFFPLLAVLDIAGVVYLLVK